MARKLKGADFAQDAGSSTSDPVKLARIVNLSRDMVRHLKKIAELEAEKKEEEEAYDLIAQNLLPDLMRECNLPSLPLGNGWTVKVNPTFRAGLPAPSTIEKERDPEKAEELKSRLAAGIAWLTAEKGRDIIKNTFHIELEVGMDKQAKAINDLINSLKVEGERVEKVHSGSLAKFLKEKIAAGVTIPFDTFAVFAGDVAELVPPPKAKK